MKKLDQSGEENNSLCFNRQNDEVPPPMVLSIDYEKYEHYLEDTDLTDEQKQEFMKALWNIIVNFVDLGFGVHPVQQALAASCGKEGKNSAKNTLPAEDDLYLDHDFLNDVFINSTDP